VKNKFDFDAKRNIQKMEKTSSEYSIYSEYLETPVFDPKNRGFDPFLVLFISFVSFIICFVFRKIQLWHVTENAEYGMWNIMCFEFLQNYKNQNIPPFAGPYQQPQKLRIIVLYTSALTQSLQNMIYLVWMRISDTQKDLFGV